MSVLRGLFPRNSLLNQSQGKVCCLSFSYMVREGNLKATFSLAWESRKGCHQSYVEYWKNWMNDRWSEVWPCLPLMDYGA